MLTVQIVCVCVCVCVHRLSGQTQSDSCSHYELCSSSWKQQYSRVIKILSVLLSLPAQTHTQSDTHTLHESAGHEIFTTWLSRTYFYDVQI